MAKHNDVGREGEDVAAEFLESKGLKVLDRNWTKSYGEIDIVARETSGLVHFVEVKSVSWETDAGGKSGVSHETPSPKLGVAKRFLKFVSNNSGISTTRNQAGIPDMASQEKQRQAMVRGETQRPEENIHSAKAGRLMRVIQAYIDSNHIEADWQFDVIAVFLDQKHKRARVRHLEDVVLGV